MPDSAYSEQLQQVLQDVYKLSQTHPEYVFEMIQDFVLQLKSSAEPQKLIEHWVKQLSALSEPRQEAGLRMFEYALLKARQSTYHPVNAMDAFIERQLYGVTDEKAIEKGTVSQLLRSQQQSEPTPVRKPPRTSTQPTNPLNPRNLPPMPPPAR
jgi:DNA-binding transcriptional regulator YbjK